MLRHRCSRHKVHRNGGHLTGWTEPPLKTADDGRRMFEVCVVSSVRGLAICPVIVPQDVSTRETSRAGGGRPPAKHSKDAPLIAMVPLACRVGLPGGTPAPFIQLTISGRKFLALLDSGATVSLFRDEVREHLERNSVRLRLRHISFHLACGSAKSDGMVRLVTRWSD